MTSPDAMMAAITTTLKDRTGRNLDEWMAEVERAGLDPLDQKVVRAWLKETHGIKQNSQWAIADAAAQRAGWIRLDIENYIDSQYSGSKAALRPIFDRLRAFAEALGDDVHVEGRASYTPFVRRRQFAAVAAATSARLDLGVRFVDPPESELLQPSKGPGQSTHKIGLTAPSDVTADVEALLLAAYQQNG